MTKLKSIFGTYSDRLQLVIDQSLSKFAPTWYQKYFTFAPAQNSLTFVSAIGRSRIEAAASIVNRDSQTPIRSRQGLEKLSGEIPAIKEMFKMSESDYRDFLMLQSMNVDEQTKKTQLLDFLFGDVKKVGDSAHKRLDIMALEAVSSGKISLSIENNPDGLVLGDPIDLLMPDSNRINAAISWDTAATATPLTDIEGVMEAGNVRGVVFDKMIMSNTLWLKFKRTKQVQDTMGLYFFGPKVTNSGVAATTLERINQYLTDNQMPTIEVNNETIGIEKDGKINTLKPFNESNVSFIPAGPLGTIKNALAIEQITPVEKVTYGQFNRAVISKWQENEPFGEWTKVELNAFPSLDTIDSIHILKAIV